jgi:hypothetical protein
LLYLCCYPCVEDNCVSSEEHIASVHIEEQGDESSDFEACTPFCFDRCCATHIFCEGTFMTGATSDFNSDEPNFYFLESRFSQLATSIWQPPKI